MTLLIWMQSKFAFAGRAALLAGAVAVLPAHGSAQGWNPFYGNSDSSTQKPKAQVEQPTATTDPFVSATSVASTYAAAERYRGIVREGGWPAIPRGPQLNPGASDARVPILRARLAAEGYRVGRSGGQFDARVQDALKEFQKRHGLRASGLLNGETLAALNVPADVRAAQLTKAAQTLTDLRTQIADQPYVIVNIPSFELQVIAREQMLLYSRVIVGKSATPTPDIQASIRAVDLMPYWHVPTSIAQRAIIPAIQKDPNYLVRERIRVFSAWGGTEVDPSTVNWFAPQATRYVFRQDPGPQNALGLIRIDMPNKHTVYMHDTPMKRLFDGPYRSQSAGCVRVQNVFALAGLLLGEDEQSVRRRLEPLMNATTTTTLRLEQPVPVHFVYLTGWVAGEGPAQFRNDVYDKDTVSVDQVALSETTTDPWQTRVFDLSP
ncbi:L,D-transpeptidase family protein [Leptospira interrogans]